MELSIIKESKHKQINEAILNDIGIRQIVDAKAKAMALMMPKFIKKGESIERYYSEDEKAILDRFDSIVELRKQQIINFFR